MHSLPVTLYLVRQKLEGTGSFPSWGYVNGFLFWHLVIFTPKMSGIFQSMGREGSEGTCPGVGLDDQSCPHLGQAAFCGLG